MVSKNNKGLAIVKKQILPLILASLIIGFMFYIFAATPTITTSTKGSNNSGVINVTCNNTDNDIQDIINASVYYNVSGGQIYTTPTYRLANATNSTGGNSSFINVTINTASFSDSTVYNISCILCNSTTCFNSTAVQNVTFDNTPPKVTNITMGAIGDGGYVNGTVTLNVSVNDSVITTLYSPRWNNSGYPYVDLMRGVGSVFFNITNSSENQIVGNFTKATNLTHMWNGSSWNVTINTSGFLDGVYNITVLTNETTGEASFTVNANNSEHIQVTIDNTAPSLTYTCTPSSVQVGQLVTCTCIGVDGVGSGVNYTTDTTTTSSTSQIVTEITTTSVASSSSRTCTVKDRVGKTASATATYTVTSAGSTGGGGGGETSSTSGATISGASTAVLKGFEENSGVKQVAVTVSADVQNAQVTVTGYTSKPEAVSAAKAGKVYKYIQIKAQNFADKLEAATITVKVEKDWVAANVADKDSVAVFRFDENSADKWNELSTTYKEEDAGYYYYDVEVESFSYFAISEKSVVEPEPEEEETPLTGNLTWLWIVIGVVVLAAIIGGGIFAGKKKRR